MTRSRCVTLVAIWLAVIGTTRAETWEVDHSRSRLLFQPTWEGVPFEGEFRLFQARIEFDPAAPADGRFDVRVNIDGADAGGSDLNEGMALPEFFDTANHPEARFVTTVIESTGGDAYVARGPLVVKGATRTVALPFNWVETDGGARLRGELTVDRTDFNVGEGEWADGEGIGVAVRIIVDLVLVRAR